MADERKQTLYRTYRRRTESGGYATIGISFETSLADFRPSADQLSLSHAVASASSSSMPNSLGSGDRSAQRRGRLYFRPPRMGGRPLGCAPLRAERVANALRRGRGITSPVPRSTATCRSVADRTPKSLLGARLLASRTCFRSVAIQSLIVPPQRTLGRGQRFNQAPLVKCHRASAGALLRP